MRGKGTIMSCLVGSLRWAGVGLLCFLAAALPARAGSPSAKPKNIRFTVHVGPGDPFHSVYQAPKDSGSPPKPQGAAVPLKVRPGETFRLTVLGEVSPGFHTYPLVGVPKQAQLTRFVYTLNPSLVPLWPIHEPEGEVVTDPVFGPIKEFKGKFEWSQDVLVREKATPGLHKLQFKVDSQVCDEGRCDFFKYPLEATIEVTSGPAIPLTPELKKREQEPTPSYAVIVDPNAGKVAQPDQSSPSKTATPFLPPSPEYRVMMLDRMRPQITPLKSASGGGADSDLLTFILTGVFWGGVSLITPCVFPMIPITVSFFLKQSEKEHHRPVAMALVYCLTIVFVLTLAAVALISFFQVLNRTPWLNFGLGALFIFFALSLLGMYEIELPSGLARFTSEREGKGGMVGTIFMALTFTIISFACVAPFLGGFGGTAGTTVRPWWHTVLGGLAFSATFAAPFFFLALFPTLLKKLPKSGSWLNSVKVVMGFLELAAAFKFLRAGELLWFSEPTFFTYDFVLGLYVALCFLCGLYLLNVYRLPHDTPAEHLTVPRLMFSMLFLGLGLYLLPGLFTRNADGDRQRPNGTIYAWVDSFLLPESHPSKDEPWIGNLEYAVNRAREHRRKTKQPKLIFVDFTGKS
jgi:thiol:disulfide interchange protein DsbD